MASPPRASQAALLRALRQKSRELDVLRRISETISCTLDQEAVLKQIIELVVEVTRSDAAFLYLLDDRRDALVLRASKTPHPGLIGRIRLELGEGITGWVARERTPAAIARNASQDSRFKCFHNLPEDQYQAFLSVPVIAKNEVIGVINVQHREPHRHQAGEISLLATIGHQVGGAIENARLYEAMQRLVRETAEMHEALEQRKLVERAKGILMRERRLSEEEAFRVLQRQSMNNRCSMKEIAQAVIVTARTRA